MMWIKGRGSFANADLSKGLSNPYCLVDPTPFMPMATGRTGGHRDLRAVGFDRFPPQVVREKTSHWPISAKLRHS
ncbi:hypothetical protein [Rhizobium leguminosarum]|uniref:hypothetical protein n=1 Tax=Rhizobium leguminosarum TaxID=384 RepID=UPI0014425AE6|nr:hypothetical protein [Rhizobium leguminosarum]